MHIKSNLLYTLALLLLTTGLCNAARAQAPVAQLYTETCSVCHGENGDGNSHARAGMNPPPKNFTAPGLDTALTRAYMIHIVRNGKPGTAMSGFDTQLSDTQIESLVDYVRTSFMQPIAVQADLPSSTRGKKIYAETCSVCHGEDGAGAMWGKTSLNPPPVNFSTQHPIHDLTRERMIASVTHGRAGTAMTAFETQLDAGDIAAVVDYIRNRFMLSTATNSVPRMQRPAASTVGMAVLNDRLTESDSSQQTSASDLFNQPVSATLNGNAETGKMYYLQNCIACHGIEGTGDGPRAYFIYPRPRNFQHPASKARFTRPVLFEAIKQGVQGREMPAWGKVMNDQKIADITEYVFNSFIIQP
jgi:mono/diheme cytochrome c family protein